MEHERTQEQGARADESKAHGAIARGAEYARAEGARDGREAKWEGRAGGEVGGTGGRRSESRVRERGRGTREQTSGACGGGDMRSEGAGSEIRKRERGARDRAPRKPSYPRSRLIRRIASTVSSGLPNEERRK